MNAIPKASEMEVFDIKDMSGISFMDGTGHTTLRWNKKRDTEMRAVISEMMDKGHIFYAAEYADKGDVTIERPIDSLDQLTERSVVVQEPTLRALVESGALKMTRGLFGPSLSVRALHSVEDVMRVATAQPESQLPAAQSEPQPNLPAVRQQSVVSHRPQQGG